MVLRDGLVVAAVGIAFGVAGAWVLERAVASLLYGVTPGEWLNWVFVAGILTAAASALHDGVHPDSRPSADGRLAIGNWLSSGQSVERLQDMTRRLRPVTTIGPRLAIVVGDRGVRREREAYGVWRAA